MPIEITMPALSPTMEEGTLAKWLKSEGDSVSAGDVIAEIETDKATMEVEAVDEGVLGKILVAEGTEEVKVNTAIALLLEEGEDRSALEGYTPKASGAGPSAEAAPNGESSEASAEAAPAAQKPAEASPLARRMAAKAGIDLSAVKGTGPDGRIVKGDVEKILHTKQGTGQGGGARGARPPAEGEPATGPGGRIFASPLARRIAENEGLDIARIAGSGPHGRIIKADVETALATGAARGGAAAAAATDAELEPAYDLVKLSNTRKIIAKRLSESKREIPHFYMTVDCETDNLLAARKRLNAASPEGEGAFKLSVNDFVIKAVAVALKQVPAANAEFTAEGLKMFKRADISVAVAVEGGLITPIIRAAETKGLRQISAEMRDLAGRAREGKLQPEEYQGGTFSISNLGMYGIREFAAVINPPQGAILAIGAGEERPVVRNGEIVIRNMMSVTLSCDHRVVDGAVGAEFLAAFRALIEEPVGMLL